MRSAANRQMERWVFWERDGLAAAGATSMAVKLDRLAGIVRARIALFEDKEELNPDEGNWLENAKFLLSSINDWRR